MIHILNQQPSVVNTYLAELRDKDVQQDPMRFRRNLERVGALLAYELSKELTYAPKDIDTPLGTARESLPTDRLVLATILRAGLPMHQGVLQIFDRAENAFVSAYRKHHKSGNFDVHLEYVSCPDLEGATLILCDAMLATGASMTLSAEALLEYGQPAHLHFLSAIASTTGLDYVRRNFPDAHLWLGAVDEELTAKSYIVPGLGDAGDLSFGEKLQE